MGWDGFQCFIFNLFVKRFASNKKMGKKIVLSPKEELRYERIITKLEKGVKGFIERGKQPLQRRRLDWFARKEQDILIYGLSCFIYF